MKKVLLMTLLLGLGTMGINTLGNTYTFVNNTPFPATLSIPFQSCDTERFDLPSLGKKELSKGGCTMQTFPNRIFVHTTNLPRTWTPSNYTPPAPTKPIDLAVTDTPTSSTTGTYTYYIEGPFDGSTLLFVQENGKWVYKGQNPDQMAGKYSYKLRRNK